MPEKDGVRYMTYGEKLNREMVRYRDETKGDARCENCFFLFCTGICGVVEGVVRNSGVCQLWSSKQEVEQQKLLKKQMGIK